MAIAIILQIFSCAGVGADVRGSEKAAAVKFPRNVAEAGVDIELEELEEELNDALEVELADDGLVYSQNVSTQKKFGGKLISV